jgi:hypothetical protein
MANRIPGHLVARLDTLTAHVRHLARDRGLEGTFLRELEVLDRSAERALEAGSTEMVQNVLAEVRALARRLAEAEQAVARVAEHGRVPASELSSTLIMPDRHDPA